jgi:hypothetical protein
MLRAPYLNCSNLDTNGLCLDPCGGWGGAAPDFTGGSNWDWQLANAHYAENLDSIVSLVKACAAANVAVLMINFPESPAYKNTDHYTRGGPSWATGRAVVAQLRSLESAYPNFHFYDAYNNGNHDYTDDEAQNWNHLCPRGAAKLSGRLDSLIHRILSDK